MDNISQTLTSIEVAELMGRTHKKVLESIRLYISQMEEIEKQNTTGTEKGWLKYFSDSTYIAGNGQEQPCYNVTKIGCEFLAHKLKGIKGTEFTMRYIDRFHDMEETISDGNKALPLTLKEQIQTIAKGTEELYQRVEGVESEVGTVKAEIEALRDELPLFPSEADKIKNAVNKRVVEILGGKESDAYNDRSLSKKVFADCYRNLKGNFENIGKYTEIKRKYRLEALRIVERYEPPFFLTVMIDNENSQHTMTWK